MKNNKSLVIGIAAILLILTVSFLVGTGFCKRTDVILTGYSVSEDGTEITLEASVQSSMGYIRGFKDDGGGIKPHYPTFYATFGGLNSSFGAKNEFVLEVHEDDREIYFNRADGGYELVLQKNTETGIWEEPNIQGQHKTKAISCGQKESYSSGGSRTSCMILCLTSTIESDWSAL